MKKIGALLQEARKKKGLSLHSVSSKLFIRIHYLEAIEDNDFHLIPSKPQLIGFITAYADHLDLDSKELIALLNQKPVEEDLLPELDPINTDSTTANKLRSQQIFYEIGKQLGDGRKKLGISLADVVSFTHIKLIHLEAIEKGGIDQFSSAAQARGMIRNYSDFLGLETDKLLVRYAEALQSKIGVKTVENPKIQPDPVTDDQIQDKRPRINIREIISLDMIVFGIVGIMIIFFLFWGIGRVLRIQTEIEPVATATELIGAESTQSSNTNQNEETFFNENGSDDQDSGQTGNDPVATIQVISGESLTINVVANIRAYLRVTVDGEVKFDGRVIAGSNLAYSAQDSIEIITGNGAAIEIIFNGSSIGKMGVFGDAVHTIFTTEGQLTPTPEPTEEIDTPELSE